GAAHRPRVGDRLATHHRGGLRTARRGNADDPLPAVRLVAVGVPGAVHCRGWLVGLALPPRDGRWCAPQYVRPRRGEQPGDPAGLWLLRTLPDHDVRLRPDVAGQHRVAGPHLVRSEFRGRDLFRRRVWRDDPAAFWSSAVPAEPNPDPGRAGGAATAEERA